MLLKYYRRRKELNIIDLTRSIGLFFIGILLFGLLVMSILGESETQTAIFSRLFFYIEIYAHYIRTIEKKSSVNKQ